MNVLNPGGHSVVSVCAWKFFDSGATQIPTTGGTASASDVSWGAAANAFDGNASTFWSAGPYPTPASPQWVQYQFASAVNPATFSITARNDSFWMQAPDSFALLASNDGTTWDTIGYYGKAFTGGAGTTNTYTVGPSGMGDAYRLVFLTNGGGGLFTIMEMVWKDAGGATISTANGGAYADALYSAVEYSGPNAAFDVGAAAYIAPDATSGTHWLAFRFSGSVTVSSFTLQSRVVNPEQTPVTFTLQKSVDHGVTWTTIQSFTAATWTSGATQTFTVGAAAVAAQPQMMVIT